MMDIYSIIRAPHVAEKGNIAKELNNQVTFKVAKNANKIEIKQAVENIFKTKVVDVKTLNVKGKKRRVGKTIGKKPDWKKAIVKLAPGEKIEFFEGM